MINDAAEFDGQLSLAHKITLVVIQIKVEAAEHGAFQLSSL